MKTSTEYEAEVFRGKRMPFNKDTKGLERTDKFILPVDREFSNDEAPESADDLLSRGAKSIDQILKSRPNLATEKSNTAEIANYKTLLEIAAAVNSTLVTDDILQIVMKRAIELLKAERGFLMLLDDANQLQFRTVYNLCKEELMQEDFKYSGTVANRVATSGIAEYTSDAQNDERFSKQESIRSLNLRSIVCVPLKIQDKVIGVIYLDSSSEGRLFFESDLYLFELFATQAAIAINNSRLYERILRLKRFNENIVSNTPVGLVVVNGQFEILTMNASAERIFGQQLASTASVTTLLDSSNLERWEQSMKNVLATGTPENLPRCYLTIGEEEKVVSAKVSPLEDTDHHGRGLIIAIEDITEKTILENYVTISEKLIAKGEMAASIGHELNNFLAIISNNAELLQIRLNKGEVDKAERSVQAILDNIGKIKRFTDNLMDLSKLDQELVNYNVNHLIDDLLFTIKSQQRFKRVGFVVRMSPEIPDIEIDVGQIQQVFLNLLYNAADALDGGTGKSEIVLTTRREGDFVVATVRDSGCGIPTENLEKVFEPHFSTKQHGHGLGLSNCKRIVENHGGQISVQSKVGEYTEFKVTLPTNR
ncbi:MAG: GAF domain-containing protein [candidate division Zixibacteria bacterium]|nr:GAF domain-containing protein [candidate division Zixibacteria bacterium]